MKTHLETITEALKFHPDAFQSLTRKVKAKGWLPLYSKLSDDDLVYMIINRIGNDTSQFGEFTAMLHDIEGMDLVVHLLNSEY